MKYPEHKLSMETALPSSVQSWLGNELEIRGIDSVIYSRYIIHLLLEDHDEECSEYLELYFNPRLDTKSRLKGHKRSHSQEERKKKAAIECLRAVSEENCGIENLVEELCNKLKELSQSSGSDDTDQGDSTPSLSDGSSSELEDPAERYYAAFPALVGQNEHFPYTENYQQNLDIWRDNPWTKQTLEKRHSKIYKKVSKQKDDKKRTKKKYLYSNQERKKQTQEKPIPKSKTKPPEYFHTRFMSWPQSEFVQGNPLNKQTTEEKKLCQQVENILKQMLLTNNTGHNWKYKGLTEYDNDGFLSPELQENAFWYTKQFAELIHPIDSGHRLYERRSCPFFHNDDVFIDPDRASENVEQQPLDDQFGLQDLLKNQELQSVAESVLQNVDEDFSKKEKDVQVPSEKNSDENVQHSFDMFGEVDPVTLLLFDEKLIKSDLSPYDNLGVHNQNLLKKESPNGDSWSTSGKNIATDSSHVLNPEIDLWSATVKNKSPDLTQELWLMDPGQHGIQECQPLPSDYDGTSDRIGELSLPAFMFTGNRADDCLDAYQLNENYSQLWDINIWNKTHTSLQTENRNFLDCFDSSFDDFKSGLNQLPERSCNRNSGVFNINLINEGLESFDMLEGENINTLIPKITFEAVNFDLMSEETQDENLHNANRAYDRSISMTDVHLLNSIRDEQLPSKEKLSRSFDLIPSNNSAFKDVVPRKITHVHSDSNINYLNYSTLIDFEDNIQQSESKEEDDKKENLYLSPKTHFRPISAIAEDELSDLHLRDLFGGYSSPKTQYQKYQDVSDSGDEDSFVPMFKVRSQHDKYIQTGSSIGEQPVPVEKMTHEDQGRPPEVIEEEPIEDTEFTQDFDVYGYVDSLTASAQNTPQNVLDVACNTCCDSGYEEANEEEKIVEEKSNWLTVSDSHRMRNNKTVEWTRQVSEDVPPDRHDFWVVTDSENVGEISSSIPDNVWSCHEDTFPDMFSFFSEDCDDLKPQKEEKHNLRVDRPVPYSVTETNSSDVEDNGQTETTITEVPKDVTTVKLVIGKGKKVLQDIENCPRENSVSQPIYMPMPRVAVYSCELEKEWLDKESPRSYGKSAKSFKGVGKKPCSFFMEGSCKRSDCKFSHDLSSITCRFWEEGGCFKGDLCPFLHSYYVSEIPVDIKENVDYVDDHFEFQEEEFPQLSVQIIKQRVPKAEKSNTFVEARKTCRTTKQKPTGKLTEKVINSEN